MLLRKRYPGKPPVFTCFQPGVCYHCGSDLAFKQTIVYKSIRFARAMPQALKIERKTLDVFPAYIIPY
jgi:hypothetical protein